MKGGPRVVRVACVVMALAGCRPTDSPGEPRPSSSLSVTSAPAGAVVARETGPPGPIRRAPILPDEGGPLAPALTRVEGGDLSERLADAGASCASCHAEVVAQWQGSAHAAASFDNPIYRVSVERFRAAQGNRASRMCAGCHDVALLVDGAMDAPVTSDDPRAHAGVSCMVCHGIVEARADGNGSYRLSADDLAIPLEDDPASLRAHRTRMAGATLRTPALCGSCHTSFLSTETGHEHHLAGADDHGAWRRSVYAGSHLDRVDATLPQRTCADCHMPRVAAPRGDAAAEGGTVRSRRFPGGHTWLAGMQGDEEQLAASRSMLKRAATLVVSALRRASGELTLPADGATVGSGEVVTLELTIRNVGVGHRFPGGTLDALDTWVEVTVVDAAGDAVASGGRRWRDGVEDDSLHRLHATVLDGEGRPVLARAIERFRAPGYDHTIPPRDRQVVRFELAVPEALTPDRWPLAVTARLMHRSREPALQRAACELSRAPTERAWAEARAARGRPHVDPCAPLPVTTLAEHRVALVRAGSALRELSPEDAGLALDHGAAWSHALVEEIDRARPSFERALRALDGETSQPARRMRATALLGLAGVAARQGRIAEMEQWLGAAEEVVPGEPAYSWLRGRALASVWRHEEAIPWLRVAAAGAPYDDRVWSALALASGSAGRHEEALVAAHEALALTPRAPDPLRTQALALRGLGRPDVELRRALDAYLEHRSPDHGPALRSRCAMDVAGFARERAPNHVHPPPQPLLGG